jgi:hypothetical protein
LETKGSGAAGSGSYGTAVGNGGDQSNNSNNKKKTKQYTISHHRIDQLNKLGFVWKCGGEAVAATSPSLPQPATAAKAAATTTTKASATATTIAPFLPATAGVAATNEEAVSKQLHDLGSAVQPGKRKRRSCNSSSNAVNDEESMSQQENVENYSSVRDGGNHSKRQMRQPPNHSLQAVSTRPQQRTTRQFSGPPPARMQPLPWPGAPHRNEQRQIDTRQSSTRRPPPIMHVQPHTGMQYIEGRPGTRRQMVPPMPPQQEHQQPIAHMQMVPPQSAMNVQHWPYWQNPARQSLSSSSSSTSLRQSMRPTSSHPGAPEILRDNERQLMATTTAHHHHQMARRETIMPPPWAMPLAPNDNWPSMMHGRPGPPNHHHHHHHHRQHHHQHELQQHYIIKYDETTGAPYVNRCNDDIQVDLSFDCGNNIIVDVSFAK